jgi:hypothetical protein
MKFIEYPFINRSHVCRLLWGASSKTETSRLTYRLKNPNSWTQVELAKLEEIRLSFLSDLQKNEPFNFL